ncbi:hypothetical protein BSQ39_00850 [Loigolactobacillus backii]|uniref:hypothetical protein n=1 Tax=Loigolactobacillus backii TaxID=375175 RepID=UPI000C1CC038|nr:hypothetical protein [Loigolactobacillus backii]PIO82207.1 hypothetical protein BSQ39_00850 [Loigolactobacillus backii]
MAELTISQLADYLEENGDAIKAGDESFNAAQIYQAIDSLAILQKPIQDYFALSEDSYYDSESDHLLTLQNGQQPLGDLSDRVIVTHTDGAVTDGELNYTYAHENVIATDYDVQTDLHILTYGFEVVGATDQLDHKLVQKTLAKDAVLSFGLAAHAIEKWAATK